MERLQSAVAFFGFERPVMEENNNTQNVWELFKGEVQEAEEVLQNTDKLAQELPDLLWFISVLANNSGINLYESFEKKYGRNELKYPSSEFQSGDYNEIMPRLKQEWKQNGGDEVFYSSLG